MKSVTTSIRLSARLAARLEQAAARLSREKDWIVANALEDYLGKLSGEELVQEARRQSLLASRKRPRKSEAFWASAADTSEWK